MKELVTRYITNDEDEVLFIKKGYYPLNIGNIIQYNSRLYKVKDMSLNIDDNILNIIVDIKNYGHQLTLG